ncbi:MAG: c-type cytochrome [Methyloligella sp. ZOD6]
MACSRDRAGRHRWLAGVIAAMLLSVLAGKGEAGAVSSIFQADGPQQIDPDFASGSELVDRGHRLYANMHCSGCHGGMGFGTAGPAFRGNERLKDDVYVVGQILIGPGIMPSFAELSDSDIAAVASYIRTSWGNDLGELNPNRVHEIRQSLAGENEAAE